MSKSTSFDFGFNVRDPSNADPWGQNTEPEGDLDRGHRNATDKNVVLSGSVSDDLPVAEILWHGKGFFGVTYTGFQTDAFIDVVISNFNSTREELRNMAQAPAPTSGGGNRQTANNNRSGSGRQQTGIPFLKLDLMSREPREARIMDYQIVEDRQNGQRKFNDIILKLYYNGSMYLWGLKFDSQLYSNLFQWFGSELDDWKEKRFLLGADVREFDGKLTTHMEPMPAGTGRSKK